MGSLVALWLLALGEGDRRTGRLPTVALLPGLIAVAALGAVHPLIWLSAAAAALPYLAAHLAGQVGGGDVKLALVVGGLAGDPATALLIVGCAQCVALAGFWVGGSSARRWAARCGRRPHGPALAGVAAVLVGAG